jgi:ArsR family transcriptional regulator
MPIERMPAERTPVEKMPAERIEKTSTLTMLDDKPLAEMAELLKLLGDRMRLSILGLLQEKELCVGDIVTLTGATQPNTSQHLRKLKSAGLVRETKRGQWVYYSLNLDDYPDLRAFLSQLPGREQRRSALSELSEE